MSVKRMTHVLLADAYYTVEPILRASYADHGALMRLLTRARLDGADQWITAQGRRFIIGDFNKDRKTSSKTDESTQTD